MKLITSILFFFLAGTADAVIKKETIKYKQGNTELEGSITYDDADKNPKPGVIIVHDWMGVGPYVEMRAQQMAEMGYVAFVADIYGKNERPKNQDEAAKFATKYKSDRKLLRARAKAAYDTFVKNPLVQKKKVAAIGYCFGGTTALEMGRDGLPLAGIVSFHGGLSNPTPADAKKIKSKVLVTHGGIDPYVPKTEVDQFLKEMDEAKVDYQFISYSGTVHSFTLKDAGTDITKGAAYNEAADRRSFQAMKDFFKEVL